MASTDSITAEKLREIVRYDPETGIFTWAKPRRRCLCGGTAGNSSHRRGYIQIRLDYKRYYAHRLAWLYVHGEWPKGVIDHINGVTSDNRIVNLRDVSQGANKENQRTHYKSAAIPLLGVSFHKATGKYAAQIRIKGKQTLIGRFSTPDEAHAAYIAAKRKHHAASTI